MTDSPFPTDREAETDAGTELVAFEDADAIFEALASETARRIFETLCAEPTVPSVLAEDVETSVQNVTHHLNRLGEAGLVETVGTRYSERGIEMNLYAPAADPVVVCIGDSRSDQSVSRALEHRDATVDPINSD